jgi:hypothetical protein
MNNKYLSLYGNRAGQFLTFQSPSPTQLAIFKVIQVTEEQHQEYISASKEKREELLEKHRSSNPQITGEKKKIVERLEAVVPVVETKSENDAIQENIETMEAIESLEDQIEEVVEKLEAIEAKMPVFKTRKPRKK